jgi:hypothetical protein
MVENENLTEEDRKTILKASESLLVPFQDKVDTDQTN